MQAQEINHMIDDFPIWYCKIFRLVGINDNYIVIGTLASGEPIIYEKSCENIAIYNHEKGRTEKNELFTDFFEFISKLDKILNR